MKNWRTSLGTIFTAIGLVPMGIAQLGLAEIPDWLKVVGGICAFISYIYAGLNAKDHNVTGGTKKAFADAQDEIIGDGPPKDGGR